MFHISAKATANRVLFRDDLDYSRFLRLFSSVKERADWVCGTFCLLTNHLHLLVTTPEPNLAKGMQSLLSVYAQGFNRRHGEFGHLVKGRYYSGLIERESHLLDAIRYIALNPVRAGLVRRPEQWRWSSYSDIVGAAAASPAIDVDDALRLFGGDTKSARRRLRSFVESGL
jgi:REP element-mobilizing transposase RayT